jgi:two-component system response regulator AtoC
MIRVLAVDDDEPFRRLLKKELSRKGFAVDVAPEGDTAARMLSDKVYDVMLLDIIMPGINGIELMKKINREPSTPPIIVLTGKATVETAVDAMKNGAFDYLTKPLKLEEMEILIHRASEYGRLSRKNEILEQELLRQENQHRLVGESQQIKSIIELVKKIAPADSTVLITGESGTGKELVANAIWQYSKRSASPFIALNCATLSGQLIESELFGHEKGSFTTAYKTKYGIVEAANKGTLLLDEVGEFPMELQAKLLRFLDSGEFRRVGGTQTLTADVRVIASTNRDLEDLVGGGQFREDLFYRLNVISIVVPPLRERMEDLPELVKFFMNKYSQNLNKDVGRISGSAMKRLQSYSWPGNIRELENVVERAVILSDSGTIEDDDLSIQGEGAAPDERGASDSYPQLEELERDYIERVLSITGGNQSKASQILGINRKTLYHKIKKFGLGNNGD